MWILELHNPWWYSDNWESEDKHLKEWNSQKIRWTPNWINEVSLKPFSLNFVIGPRQVGKTTGLKFLIKKLIENGENPRKIIYINVEALGTLSSFKTFLKYITENFEGGYLFLDEVTALVNWHVILKSFIDLGKLEKFSIVCSGSSTINLLRVPESFIGRRGNGKDIVLLPLSFKEFVEVNGIKKEDFVFYSDKIKKLFENYLEVGGFPRSINNDERFYSEFMKELKSEVKRNNKYFHIFEALIKEIFDIAPSSISYSSLANKLGISRPTLEDYLEFLEESLIGKVVFWKNHKEVFRKEKKIILRDPAIVKALSISFEKEIGKDFLYEWVVQEHLFRKYGEIFYYKNSYEIDCIADNLKIEVKAGKPHREYPKNVIILDEDNIAEFLLKL